VGLVDHAAGDSSSPHRCVDRDDHAGVVVRCVLTQALMWTVVVEVTLARAEHGTSVAVVVDQYAVSALDSDATD
jgi:hypothetical protein